MHLSESQIKSFGSAPVVRKGVNHHLFPTISYLRKYASAELALWGAAALDKAVILQQESAQTEAGIKRYSHYNV